MIYMVRKTNGSFHFNDDWEKGLWGGTKSLNLNNHMGDKPEHFPRTQAKVLYDDNNIYIFFLVEDKYVRTVANTHQGLVWKDSCVEFFFTPGDDITEGYFNVEANCGGFILFHHQQIDGKNMRMIVVEDINKMMIQHSMPQIVESETLDPTIWTLKYALPFDIIEKYAPVKKPHKGTKWKANFYKCADGTSHPHWLTWSIVDNPTPYFHLPQYFGFLEFD